MDEMEMILSHVENKFKSPGRLAKGDFVKLVNDKQTHGGWRNGSTVFEIIDIVVED